MGTDTMLGGWQSKQRDRRDPDMGTDTELRHGIRTARLLIRRTWPSAARTVQAGEAARYGDRHGAWAPAVQIEGQTRCPIYRSGTFNVQRSTLNVQWGDRKGPW